MRVSGIRKLSKFILALNLTRKKNLILFEHEIRDFGVLSGYYEASGLLDAIQSNIQL